MTRKNGRPKAKTVHSVRCAIYTRKSTDEGLEQEFNSLDAQRESGEAYIASQQHEGWMCLPDHYYDGGFTGGNMDRPAVRHLMADIEAGEIDCVVVYKVDRLSRSLLDFARMLETFEKHHVAFVSVTQHFNTATPMGRLILNVLLSFAQFDRELIAERTRDKIAATRRKGKWSGGMPLLGYSIGRDPGVVAATLAEAQSQAEEGIRRLEAEHARLQRQLRRDEWGIHDLATKGVVGVEAVGTLADLQERATTAERRLTEIRQEVAAMERELVSEDEVVQVLTAFEPVWEPLAPREQAQVIQLLIEAVGFDAGERIDYVPVHGHQDVGAPVR
ncbi:MAG: recombinase family protein [Pirellulaceae bacterium]